MLINDRLSTFLTQHAGEMAFVQRSHNQRHLWIVVIALAHPNPSQNARFMLQRHMFI